MTRKIPGGHQDADAGEARMPSCLNLAVSHAQCLWTMLPCSWTEPE